MKAYQDKTTGKWKWGTRGEAKHESKAECERWGMDELYNKLKRLRERLGNTIHNHGK